MTEDFVKPKKTKFDRKKIDNQKRKNYSEEENFVEPYSRKQKHKINFLAEAEEEFNEDNRIMTHEEFLEAFLAKNSD